MATLVLTEICDECDEERPTELCDWCDRALCSDCMPKHKCDESGLLWDDEAKAFFRSKFQSTPHKHGE